MEDIVEHQEQFNTIIEYARSFIVVRLNEARQRGETTINLTLDTPWFMEAIDRCLKHIQSGERVQLSLSPSITHHNKSTVDWEWLHGLKEDLSGEAIPRDVFLTIRHGGDNDPVVIVDIYHI